MLATLTLLWEPASWIHQVDEAIGIDRTELVRTVCVNVQVPSTHLSEQPLIADAPDASTTFFVPIMTPRKDVLPDLRDVVCDRPDQHYAMATHGEHVAISCALIRARFFQTWLPPLVDELQDRIRINEQRNITLDEVAVLVRDLQAIADELCQIPSLPPDKASTIVEQMFSEEKVTSLKQRPDIRTIQLIRTFRRPARDENRLYLLCSMLAARYLKVLRVPSVQLGDRLQIDYVCRQGYKDEHPRENRSWFDKRQDLVRELLGARPSHLRFPLPLARRTAHYTFRFRAPTNYFLRAADFVKKGDERGREKLRGSLYDVSSDGSAQPSVAKELGGQAEAFLMLADGQESPDQLDAAIVCYELPPGATAFSAVVAMLVTVIAAATYAIVRTSLTAPANDVPALLVALAASSGVVATPFLPKSELYAAPLLSRVTLFVTGIFGNLFALWLVLRQGRVTSTGWGGSLASFVQIHGGLILLGLMVTTTGIAFRRLWRLCARYLKARGTDVLSMREFASRVFHKFPFVRSVKGEVELDN
jgi:hypothetical protein